jgi:Zn-dependent protease
MIPPPLPIQIFILLFAVVVHEYSHGWMAEKCGDDTARVMGRVTLNPLPHLDLFGSILLPLLLILTRSPFLFAWAKPVPINPARFNNPRKDIIKVGFSGPGANFILAVISAAVLWLIPARSSFTDLLYDSFNYMVLLNLVLGVFNLVPIPPLDGSRVLSGFLPRELSYRYNLLEPYGFIIIIFLFYSGLISSLLWPVVVLLHRLLLTAF